jgi:prepilin-type processing-associated H-X9-DG protein
MCYNADSCHAAEYGSAGGPGMFSMTPVAANFAQATDGTSNTILVGEQPHYRGTDGQIGWVHRTWTEMFAMGSTVWTINANLNLSGPGYYRQFFGSYHPGGANFVLTDGSVRFISSNVNVVTFNYLGTRSGGEVIGDY